MSEKGSKQRTEIICVIDKSGSMHGLEEDTIGGFNKMIEDQKAIEGEALVTLVLFDTEYITVYENEKINSIAKLTREAYVPSGCTALLDALGDTIKGAKKRIKGLDKADKPDKVIVVIITDGQENSSRKYDNQKIKQMIEKRTEKGWEFLYLGANQDAFAEAQKYGINRLRVANFGATREGIESSYSGINSYLSTVRGGGEATEDWKEGIK